MPYMCMQEESTNGCRGSPVPLRSPKVPMGFSFLRGDPFIRGLIDLAPEAQALRKSDTETARQV